MHHDYRWKSCIYSYLFNWCRLKIDSAVQCCMCVTCTVLSDILRVLQLCPKLTTLPAIDGPREMNVDVVPNIHRNCPSLVSRCPLDSTDELVGRQAGGHYWQSLWHAYHSFTRHPRRRRRRHLMARDTLTSLETRATTDQWRHASAENAEKHRVRVLPGTCVDIASRQDYW